MKIKKYFTDSDDKIADKQQSWNQNDQQKQSIKIDSR